MNLTDFLLDQVFLGRGNEPRGDRGSSFSEQLGEVGEVLERAPRNEDGG